VRATAAWMTSGCSGSPAISMGRRLDDQAAYLNAQRQSFPSRGIP
jgi:hypothetical protein